MKQYSQLDRQRDIESTAEKPKWLARYHSSSPRHPNEFVTSPLSLIESCSDQLITDKLVSRQTLIRAFELIGDVILDQNIIYLATFLENAAMFALADAYYSLDEIGYAKYVLNDSFGQKPLQSYAWSKKLVMDSIAVVKRFAQIF